ncbi:MAG: hypothetical protein K0S33_4211 [Bacteroidetes bacterium]|jgi:RimJ/RimL family protein N-acetyltransferase|nr:hypothetical protein [Bacteroidota bacterium]
MQFDQYTIRLLDKSDSLSYYKMIDSNRPRLEDYFATTVSKTRTYEESLVYLGDVMERLTNKSYLPFVIVDTSTGDFAGYIDVKNINWKIPKGEFGCFFDERYTGKGLSKKAFSMVIDHLFNEYGFNKLFLRTHETNTAARALAERCGFIKEGLIRKDHITTKGEIIDLVYYGLVRE